MDELLLEPLKFYTSVKDRHRDEVNAFFESLVQTSGVDVEANHKTVAAYRAKLNEANAIKSKRGWFVALRVFLIVLMVALGLAALYFFVSEAILLGIFCVAVFVGLIILNIKVLGPILKKLKEAHDACVREAERIRAEAEAQMAPLNRLFDNTQIHRLIEKVMPRISFHTALSPAQFMLFVQENDHYVPGADASSVDMVSGTLCENPFLFLRSNLHFMREKIYTGSIVISWTERVRGSDGKMKTVTRRQTLTASITRPAPVYTPKTCLYYGNQAAPDLTFSRDFEHVEDLSDRALARKIDRGEDKLQERARKATSHGGSFQEMANIEFDVLFDAHDRDHEVQFRVMYTPLAQQNTTALILDETEGWGDDFCFYKQKRCNIIQSEHAQSWDMNISAGQFRSYDVEQSRATFERRNVEYFRSVFFDMAPLLAIPAYQDPPSVTLDEVPAQPTCGIPYEYEALANAIGWRVFSAENAASEGAILKTKFVRKAGETDYVEVTSHAHYTVPQVEFVPRLGGDGRMHSVPVHWLQYIPVETTRTMAVQYLGLSEREFVEKRVSMPQDAVYLHGYLAYPM